MQARVVLVAVLLLLAVFLGVDAKSAVRKPQVVRKPKPTSKTPAIIKGKAALDREFARRRSACAANTEVVKCCLSDELDTENCVMKCISQTCYTKHFSEPLELGEIAFDRSQRFKRCVKDEIKSVGSRAARADTL